MPSDAKVSAGDRAGRWFDRNRTRLAFLVIGLLIGLGSGWWAGGFVACSRSISGCEVRVESIEAAGTWFGAIGTVAAVLTAVAAFRVDERRKHEEQRLARLSDTAREERFTEEASRVRIECQANHWQGGQVRGYVVSITNGSDQTPVFGLKGRDFASHLNGIHELGGGQTVSTRRNPGDWQLLPEAPATDKTAFEQWCVREVTIKFKMNGRLWRRTGHEEVESIESWELEGPDAPGWTRSANGK